MADVISGRGVDAAHRIDNLKVGSDKGDGDTPGTCFYCGSDTDRPYKGAHRNGLPTRILDLLELGDRMTISEIADRLNVRQNEANRALYRLRERGLVDRRLVDGVGVWRV